MIRTRYIPDLIEEVVERVSLTFSTRLLNPFSVYFEPGYHSDVQKILLYKEQDPSKPRKYPLIWLVTPIKVEDHLQKKVGITTLHFVIIQDTSNTYLMEERRDNTIGPVLIPIYDELVRQMRKATNYFSVEQANPVYDIIHFAKADADGTNLFSDFVDVIDMKWKVEINAKQICITS